MKNGKWIGPFVFLILTISTFSVMAGCIEDQSKIEGTIHNNTDDRTVISLYGLDGSMKAQNTVDSNSAEIWELYPGQYRVTASLPNVEYFAETEFTLSPTDSSFTIIVYEDSLSATSG